MKTVAVRAVKDTGWAVWTQVYPPGSHPWICLWYTLSCTRRAAIAIYGRSHSGTKDAYRKRRRQGWVRAFRTTITAEIPIPEPAEVQAEVEKDEDPAAEL